ncbi:MAG: LysM peptidoglycan-binding domain-containing protein [Bacilli bacterium]
MYKVYQIQVGENLDSLVKKFGTTKEELMKLNGFNEKDFNVAGSYIIVPVSEDSKYITYTVQNGDSIYGISRTYNIDPNLLFKINGLDSGDFIYPGQKILIPVDKNIYITKDGDTLESVVKGSGYNLDDFVKNNDTLYLVADQIINYK